MSESLKQTDQGTESQSYQLRKLTKKGKQELLSSSVSNFKRLSRYGGDEFVLDLYSEVITYFLENYPYKGNYQSGGIFADKDATSHYSYFELISMDGIMSNWASDLIMVLMGRKPMCLVDNDDFPSVEEFDKSDMLYSLRYWCLQFGMERIALIYDEGGALYCWPEGKVSALLLRDIDLYASLFLRYGAISKLFPTSILLGYSYESTSDYAVSTLKLRKSIKMRRTWDEITLIIDELLRRYHKFYEDQEKMSVELTKSILSDPST